MSTPESVSDVLLCLFAKRSKLTNACRFVEFALVYGRNVAVTFHEFHSGFSISQKRGRAIIPKPKLYSPATWSDDFKSPLTILSATYDL